MFKHLFSPRTSAPLPDLSALAVDMHSHLIPGIDDGVRTVDESLALISRFSELGYRKLITTPHVNIKFPNTSERILKGRDELKAAVEKAGIPIQIEAAAEYLLEDGFEILLEKKDFLSFGDNHLLIELSYYIPHPAFSEIIYELQSSGYSLILAHAERYAYWHHNLAALESLVDRDVKLQVNLSSLSGYYGSEVRNMARRLISNGWVSYAGSDVHNKQYLDNFLKGAADKYAVQLLGSGLLRNQDL